MLRVVTTVISLSSLLTLAAAPVALCQTPAGAAPPAAGAPPRTLPPVPPPLSRKKWEYFQSHPAEFQQLMQRLPRRTAQPVPAAMRAPATPGAWRAVLTNAPASGLSNPLLLTDGSVIVHVQSSGDWYKLSPRITGRYDTGGWKKIASLPSGYAPLYFASQVLDDGKVIVNGGEYNSGSSVWTNLGALYDPIADTWTSVAPPSGFANIGDAQSIILNDGTYMLANALTKQEARLSYPAMTWTATGTNKFDENDEEGWVLRPDGNVLTTDAYVNSGTCGKGSELYNSSTGAWSNAGNATTQLSDCNAGSYEVGPLMLRPFGSIVAFSGVTNAVAGTSIRRAPPFDDWIAGPNIPTIGGQNYDLADAPAASLPSNNILFAASPGLFSAPTHFFEFTGGNTIVQTADPPNASFNPSYVYNFLLLPTGEVLMTDFSSTVYLYTQTGSTDQNQAPKITSVPTTLTRPLAYRMIGTGLNGQANGGYGDDQQSATNFPLVLIVNKATQHYFYARTTGFRNRAIGNVTSAATFKLYNGIETGPSTLYAIANGIRSAGVDVTVN